MAAKKTTESVTPSVANSARQSRQMLQRANDDELRRLQIKQKELLAAYKAQEKIEITVSPMYAPYFGKNQPVELNGCKIYIPCDGRAYKIPKSFAMEVKSRIRRVDDQAKNMKRMSDIRANVESYVGEKNLISRA